MCYTTFENGVIEDLTGLEKRIERIEEKLYIEKEMAQREKEKEEKKELKMWGEQ